MSRFLFGTISLTGHVNPCLPIVRSLVERGHEVFWYTGIGFKSKVEATGAYHIPILTGLDLSYANPIHQSFIEKKNSLNGLNKLKYSLKHHFIDSAVVQLKALTDILHQFPADILVADSYFLGASWLHEIGGPPWAALNTTGLLLNSDDTAPFSSAIKPDASTLGRWRNRFLNWLYPEVLFNDVTAYLDQVRGSVGLPPLHQGFFNATLSPFLFLQATVPEFEYPRSDLPPSVHFIGSLLPEPSTFFTPPAWWDDLNSGKPVIHVTQGTLATNPENLIVPTLRALANEDVLVVATLGGKSLTSIKFDNYPANARIEQFVSHYHLLPHVNVMVTNGGYGGVQAALSFGVPLVVAGQTEEKPEVCARVEWAGVGINLKTNKPTPIQVRDAVRKILTSADYQKKVQLFQAQIARYNAAKEAVILLEQLAATKQPVLRVLSQKQ